MATKRSKRIDPNEAFAAIVGAGPKTPPAVEKSAEEQNFAQAAPRPAAAESAVQKALANNPLAVPPNVEPAPNIGLNDSCTISTEKDGLPEYTKNAGSFEGGFTPTQALRPAAAESAVQHTIAAAEPQNPPAARLVQKGYYITEEQHRRLGFFAVMQGTDRSFIVRKALEEYFKANGQTEN